MMPAVSFCAHSASIRLGILLLVPFGPLSLQAQKLYVANTYQGGTVAEYSTSGVPIDLSLITGLGQPWGIAVSGEYIFVANTSGVNGVGKYTLSGATVNANLIPNDPHFGGDQPRAVAASGQDLFVLRASGVSKYTTDGVLINPGFSTVGLYLPTAMALAGSDLFVTNYNGTVTEYTTSGVEVNPALISGLGNATFGIAIADGHIFVSNALNKTIGEYNMDGSVVNASLITGFGGEQDGPFGIAALDSDLFVANGYGGIGEYSTSGSTENATLISTGFEAFQGIVAVPDATSTLELIGSSVVLLVLIGRRPPRAA